MRGVAMCLVTVCLPSVAFAMQEPSPAAAKKHAVTIVYEQARKLILTTAEKMPAEAFGFRPAADVKSFAELAGHVVDTNFGVCAGAKKVDNPRKGKPVEGLVLDRDALLRELQASFAYCDEAFAALLVEVGTDLAFDASHNAHVAGLMELYLRLNGIALPRSELDRRAQAGGTLDRLQ